MAYPVSLPATHEIMPWATSRVKAARSKSRIYSLPISWGGKLALTIVNTVAPIDRRAVAGLGRHGVMT